MHVYSSKLWIWLNCAVQYSRMEGEKEGMETMILRQLPPRQRGASQLCSTQDQEGCTCPQQPCVLACYQVSVFIPAAATPTAVQTVKVESTQSPSLPPQRPRDEQQDWHTRTTVFFYLCGDFDRHNASPSSLLRTLASQITPWPWPKLISNINLKTGS